MQRNRSGPSHMMSWDPPSSQYEIVDRKRKEAVSAKFLIEMVMPVWC
jgi:hypothetical protein